MNLTEQESIFCQALAMTSLLGELSNKDFLNSDYYNENITFIGNNDNLKKILKASGLGNPATMQMFLYILLVMPKETLSRLDTTTINSWENALKTTIQSFNVNVTTTYPGESSSDLSTVNRNAVSHAKCVYETEKVVHMLLLKIKLQKIPIIVKLKCLRVMWEAYLKCYKNK